MSGFVIRRSSNGLIVETQTGENYQGEEHLILVEGNPDWEQDLLDYIDLKKDDLAESMKERAILRIQQLKRQMSQ